MEHFGLKFFETSGLLSNGARGGIVLGVRLEASVAFEVACSARRICAEQ